MKIVLTGTGTSHGIPVIGCNCNVCTSTDSRDTRFRCAALVFADDGTTIAIDTPPEFRLQALRNGLTKLDAVLVTHSHADHVHGLDDVRIFSSTKKENTNPPLKIFANKDTIEDIKNRFDYVFKSTQLGGGKPQLDLIDATKFTAKNPICIGSLLIEPIPILHGKLPVFGWKITDTKSSKTFAYITDCNFISDSSIEKIKGVDVCILDSLRLRPHTTHFSFQEGLEYAKKIRAKSTYFTHICHDNSHMQIQDWINNKWTNSEQTLSPAYDGLELLLD